MCKASVGSWIRREAGERRKEGGDERFSLVKVLQLGDVDLEGIFVVAQSTEQHGARFEQVCEKSKRPVKGQASYQLKRVGSEGQQSSGRNGPSSGTKRSSRLAL